MFMLTSFALSLTSLQATLSSCTLGSGEYGPVHFQDYLTLKKTHCLVTMSGCLPIHSRLLEFPTPPVAADIIIQVNDDWSREINLASTYLHLNLIDVSKQSGPTIPDDLPHLCLYNRWSLYCN